MGKWSVNGNGSRGKYVSVTEIKPEAELSVALTFDARHRTEGGEDSVLDQYLLYCGSEIKVFRV